MRDIPFFITIRSLGHDRLLFHSPRSGPVGIVCGRWADRGASWRFRKTDSRDHAADFAVGARVRNKLRTAAGWRWPIAGSLRSEAATVGQVLVDDSQSGVGFVPGAT